MDKIRCEICDRDIYKTNISRHNQTRVHKLKTELKQIKKNQKSD